MTLAILLKCSDSCFFNQIKHFYLSDSWKTFNRGYYRTFLKSYVFHSRSENKPFNSVSAGYWNIGDEISLITQG